MYEVFIWPFLHEENFFMQRELMGNSVNNIVRISKKKKTLLFFFFPFFGCLLMFCFRLSTWSRWARLRYVEKINRKTKKKITFWIPKYPLFGEWRTTQRVRARSVNYWKFRIGKKWSCFQFLCGQQFVTNCKQFYIRTRGGG